MKIRLLLRFFFGFSFILSALGCDFQSLGLSAKSHNWVSYMNSIQNRSEWASNPHLDLAQAHFIFDDFGTLTDFALKTNALPWKLYSTALLLSEADQLKLPYSEESVFRIMQHYGFLRPSSIANWDHERSPEPKILESLGLQKALASSSILGGNLDSILPIVTYPLPRIQVEIANINCAACHAGVMYNDQGLPTNQVWLGTPNTSINFQGFVSSIYKGLKIAASNRHRFVQKIKATYPNMGFTERNTLQFALIPLFAKKMKALESTLDRPIPFTAGGPGLTNGISVVKEQVGLIDLETFSPHEAGLVSIPDLGNRAFRSSLLVDGAYSLPNTERFETVNASMATPAKLEKFADLVTFFLVPSSASTFQNAERVIPDVKATLGFVARYQSPRFPGRLNEARVLEGSQLYAKHCATCHGIYEPATPAVLAGTEKSQLKSYPNRFVPQNEMGTDSTRWSAITEELLSKIRNDSENPFYRYVNPKRNEGYVAPLLSGVWATAPYLHNGSVPTLWHLMHPEERPAQFYSGGHKLDFEKVGIAGHLNEQGVYVYPDSYTAWSEPTLYDTQTPGRSNTGHGAEFKDLTEDEKTGLLEYMKTL